MPTNLDKRFFDSSRGRIVTSLRASPKTVNELAAELELTDNAVRAHLLSLERDGLVTQRGVQRGTRKPHFTYELTSEADSLFPKAYDALLNQLINVLKGRLSPAALDEVLREVGRSLAAMPDSDRQTDDLETRIGKALKVLESIGGAAQLQKVDDKLFIRSNGCPIATAVAEHPELCQLTEALLAEIIGSDVREQCDRDGPPRCAFEISQESPGNDSAKR
ncbi:MAG TPA: ArsR family transcriptional regulator [Pyrinomonadaceae bacterium]|nr:ArsR family transcriptional regulator [Pyrinomonadaceae bacterium]